MSAAAGIASDWALALALCALGLAALVVRDLLRAVTLYIGFGLLLALAWVRQQAPDLALAEAALGAGVVGGLALRAWADLHGEGRAPPLQRRVWPLGLLAAAAVLGALLLLVLAPVARAPVGLHEPVHAALAQTGVTHPVTAVLLDFRAFDTLLELAVLLGAVLAVRGLGRAATVRRVRGPVVEGFTRTVVPLMALLGGYLLWRGASAPGGAFQAGAVLGAAGILLYLVRGWRGVPGRDHVAPLVAGVVVFALVGVVTTTLYGGFLDYPQPLAGMLILLVEAAATVSVGAAMVVLFAGGAGAPDRARGDAGADRAGSTRAPEPGR